MANISENEVLEIVRNALEIENEDIGLDSSPDNLEAWDSIGHLSILASLDSALDGKAAGIADLATADSVRKILRVLKDNALIG